MTSRQLKLEVRALMQHVVDRQGKLDAKMARAVFEAVAKSDMSNKARLLKGFVAAINHYERQQRAVVTSAAELNTEEKRQIEKILHEKYPSLSTIDWQRKTDLLAGITAQIGDTWYDLSIKQRLAQVQERLG